MGNTFCHVLDISLADMAESQEEEEEEEEEEHVMSNFLLFPLYQKRRGEKWEKMHVVAGSPLPAAIKHTHTRRKYGKKRNFLKEKKNYQKAGGVGNKTPVILTE